MNNFFDLNSKLQEALTKYSKTTETMFKYQKKIMKKQYDSILDVVKIMNSIDLDLDLAINTKKAKPTAKKETTKPVAKITPVKPSAKTVVKATPKPVAKKVEKKTVPVKKVSPVKKPIVKTTVKSAIKKVNKNTQQDKLAALKAATQQAVKTNKKK